MMLMGRALFRAGLKLIHPIKYSYPIINNAKTFSDSIQLPFESHYSASDLAIMQYNFEEEDSDHDKFIDMYQFNHFIRRTMGRSLDSRELLYLFSDLDKNRDGLLNLIDIVEHFEKQFQPKKESELKAAFCIYDKDEDGRIELHELREVLFHLGFFVSRCANIEVFFNKRDTRNRRTISYEDFKNLIKEDLRQEIIT